MLKPPFKTLSVILLATAAFASAAAAASANDYYVVVPVPGRQAAKVPVPTISVVLNQATLSVGQVGTLYPAVDLAASLQVLGDANYDSSKVTWAVTAGSLPAGLQLASGVLSGTPGVATAGADFTVQATYKTKTGQRAYTIVVNGVTLQVVSLAAGGHHTCAVTTGGGLKCWGNDAQGQLGNDASLEDKATPVDVAGLTSGVASVSAGTYHTCAVTTAGGLKCWGYDNVGQLGNDEALVGKATPANVAGLTSGVASVSAGRYHTCAVTTAGGLKCWGFDGNGQLGNGDGTTNTATPGDVSGLTSGVASVFASYSHTCAVTTAGGLKCWGDDAYGQLGNDAALTQQDSPVDVSGLTSGVASVAAGLNHTCAVTTGGGLKCWGNDAQGQLGNDAALVGKATPANVAGLTSGVASVAAGSGHTCVVTTSGGVKCWGADAQGQLGNDAVLTDQATPVDVAGLTSGVVSASAGRYHTCAVTSASGVKCWGSGGYGQLGNDAALPQQPTPLDVVVK